MKRALTILVAFLLVTAMAQNVAASGEGAATLYNQGNALYAKGDYQGAVKSYLHAIEQRVADPKLEQNIGSAYFKLDDPGMAIYHFERGLLLDPRDQDLRYNLKFAKLHRKDEIPAGDFFLSRWFEGITNYFTSKEFVAALSFFFIGLCLSLLLLIFVQGRARPALIWTAACFGFFLVLVLPFGASKYYGENYIQRAVLVSKSVKAHSGPGQEQSEVFTAHAGMPCRILESRSGWERISIETGLTGWVSSKDIKTIRF